MESKEDPVVKVEPLPLEFITLTERPADQKADFSYTIRSRAMHSFIQTKNTTISDKEQSKYRAAVKKESKSAAELSGRFKLSTWSRKPRRKIVKTEPKGSTIVESGMKSGSITNSLQPYSLLPIDINSRTLNVLYHFNTAFISNAFAINYDGAWVPFSATDAALFHACLSLVAQHQDVLRDAEDSRNSLYHRGQAMKLLNQRLVDQQHYLSDVDVTSVAILVIIESINGTFEAAQAHGAGLLRMISLRGGISSFRMNTSITRVLAWSDLVSSTRWGNIPQGPALNIAPPQQHLSKTLSKTVAFDLPTEYIYTSRVLDPEAADILERIQHMSHAIDIPNLSLDDKKAICDALYATEYQILGLEHSQTGGEMSTLSQAFSIASLLYLHLVMREFPNLSKVHDRLLTRLLILLRSISWDEIERQEASKDVLLWAAFVAAAASSPSHPAREYFYLVANAMGSDRDKASERFKRVAWRSSICEKLLERVWHDMSRQTAKDDLFK